MLIIACISGHGFGHGSRVAALLGALHRLEPQCRFLLSTPLPEAFLKQAFAAIPHQQRNCCWDVGVVQADALGSDPAATLQALEALEPLLANQVELEAQAISAMLLPGEKAVVLADVAPAAVLLAERLALPLVWQANFGWDAIYQELGGELVAWAKRCNGLYRRGTALLECPFCLEMDWELPKCQIGLSAGVPRLSPDALRQRIGWNFAKQKTAMLSFGGMGFPLDRKLLQRWPDWGFFVAEPELALAPNAKLLPHDLRPLDLLPICGVVITKPGYSTFCEALGQGIGVIAVERQGFAEAEVLLEGLRNHGWHRCLSRGSFLKGEWQLDEPLIPPAKGPLAPGGEIEAARYLLKFLT